MRSVAILPIPPPERILKISTFFKEGSKSPSLLESEFQGFEFWSFLEGEAAGVGMLIIEFGLVGNAVGFLFLFSLALFARLRAVFRASRTKGDS